MANTGWEPPNNMDDQNGSKVVNSVSPQRNEGSNPDSGTEGSVGLLSAPSPVHDWRDFTFASGSKE